MSAPELPGGLGMEGLNDTGRRVLAMDYQQILENPKYEALCLTYDYKTNRESGFSAKHCVWKK